MAAKCQERFQSRLHQRSAASWCNEATSRCKSDSLSPQASRVAVQDALQSPRARLAFSERQGLMHPVPQVCHVPDSRPCL